MTQDEHPAAAPGAGDPRKRWDIDERYVGVADASAFAPAIGDLEGLARADGSGVVFEVVTGIPDGAGPFATHGHTIRLTLHPAP